MGNIKERYFKKFNELPKETAKLAKENFNIEFAMGNMNPETTEDAIFFGINWHHAQPNFQFWNQLHNS